MMVGIKTYVTKYWLFYFTNLFIIWSKNPELEKGVNYCSISHSCKIFCSKYYIIARFFALKYDQNCALLYTKNHENIISRIVKRSSRYLHLLNIKINTGFYFDQNLQNSIRYVHLSLSINWYQIEVHYTIPSITPTIALERVL